MRKYSTAMVAAMVAALAVTAPASANEGRVEVRGGPIFVADETEATVGVAAGYDFDLGSTMFVGAEVSADKVLIEDANIYVGFTGRVGGHIGERGKLFAAGGYTVSEGEDVWHLGAGYEHRVADAIYVKGEYRHYFSDFANADADAVVVGVGYKF